MITRQILGDIELIGYFLTERQDYRIALNSEGVSTDSLSSNIHRNLGSIECMGEYFRNQSGQVLSTEEYEQCGEKPNGDFIFPPSLEESIGKSKASELIIARKIKTGEIVGSLLNYVTDIRTAYDREFKAHYGGQLKSIELSLQKYYGEATMDFNILSSIGVNIDIPSRLRLIIMMRMVKMWASQVIQHQQDNIPGLAEMNRGVGDKENGFFRACKKNYGIQELELVSTEGTKIIAKNNKSTYNSTMTTFGKESIFKMASQ